MATDVSFAAPVAHSPTHEDHPLIIDGPRMLPAGCWTLPVLSLFCLFLVDNASLLALFALSFCDLRMGLRVGLWNHILGFLLVVGHNSPPVSGVNVTKAGSVPVWSRSDNHRCRLPLSTIVVHHIGRLASRPCRLR